MPKLIILIEKIYHSINKNNQFPIVILIEKIYVYKKIFKQPNIKNTLKSILSRSKLLLNVLLYKSIKKLWTSIKRKFNFFTSNV